MLKSLLHHASWLLLLTACATASHKSNRITDKTNSRYQTDEQKNANVADLSLLAGDKKPLSLLDLPQTQDGEIILAPGFYETDFKSYCLQPGTPDPSERDAYLQMPLNAYRKDIIETVLRHSLEKPGLEQRNIQLLLWSVVSGSDFNRLPRQVQSTAEELLSSKQIFRLKGGVMGVVKNVSGYLPSGNAFSGMTEMKKLFELGNSSYEAYERIAVLNQPSVIKKADYKKDQWYKQQNGYYLRYFPNSYKQVKIQVYVPEGLLDSAGKRSGDYLLFDPVTMMAAPANSNAQHLGIGAPVVDIIRKVIEVNKDNRPPKPVKKKPQTNKDPKSGL